MKQTRYYKIIRVGEGIGVKIPAGVARELNLKRGDYLDLAIVDKDTIIARRLKVVAYDNFEEREDDTLDKINHG